MKGSGRLGVFRIDYAPALFLAGLAQSGFEFMPTHGQYSRENLLEVRLQINAVYFLHPRVVEKIWFRWCRATLFVNFANRNFV